MRDHAFGCNCKRHVNRPWNRAEHWSTRELAYLEKWYGRATDEHIAKVLGRTVLAIDLRAKRAGIRKRDAGMSSREVARMFGADESTVSKIWIKRGLLKAERAAFRQGSHYMWLVQPEDIEAFIVEHGQYVDVERMPESAYRDLAEQHRFYSQPEIERLTGKEPRSLATSIRRGVYPAARRGTHLYISAEYLPLIRSRVLRVGRWTSLAKVRYEREAQLERKRNRRKGVAA
jgi:hypothetical protein